MAELTDEHHNQNREILQQLHQSAPDEVAKTLKAYDYDEEGEVIYKEMSKRPKKDLQLAAEFLQNISTEEKILKNKLVTSIIDRIDSLLLEFCRKCNKFYNIKKEDRPTISCYKCGQGAHDECYKEMSKHYMDFPGMVYVCSRCEGTSKKSTPLTHKAPAPENPDSQDDDQNKDENDETPVCQKYRRGTCPHGISGKTKVNNEICQFAHPKRCQKLCIYGPHSEMGCNKGRECEFFHPILCRYALKYRRCINRQCRFTHIRGTRRYRARNENENQRYALQQNQDGSQNPEPNQPPAGMLQNQNVPVNKDEKVPEEASQAKAPEAPNQGNTSNSIPFLAELIQQMIDIKKEMKEVRELYQRPIPTISHYPPFNFQIPTNQETPSTMHTSSIPTQSLIQQQGQSRSPQQPSLNNHPNQIHIQQHQLSNPVMQTNPIQNQSQIQIQ